MPPIPPAQPQPTGSEAQPQREASFVLWFKGPASSQEPCPTPRHRGAAGLPEPHSDPALLSVCWKQDPRPHILWAHQLAAGANAPVCGLCTAAHTEPHAKSRGSLAVTCCPRGTFWGTQSDQGWVFRRMTAIVGRQLRAPTPSTPLRPCGHLVSGTPASGGSRAVTARWQGSGAPATVRGCLGEPGGASFHARGTRTVEMWQSVSAFSQKQVIPLERHSLTTRNCNQARVWLGFGQEAGVTGRQEVPGGDREEEDP